MKILFLSWAYSPHVGGVEKHVQRVAEELVQQGHQVTVLTSKIDRSMPDRESLHQVHIVRIPFNTEDSKKRTWKWVVSHREFIVDFDVVHAHDIFWWILPIYPLIHKKVFVTFHGWEGVFPVKKTAVIQRRIVAKLARGVVHVGDYIEKWYGTKADVVTYGAVDEDFYKGIRFPKLAELKSNSENIFVSKNVETFTSTGCFVGRLSKDNDIDKVISLFALYKKTYPKSKFIFVGDGEYREQCKSVGEVTGFTDRVKDYLNHARFVCASSYLSIMEAQRMGRIVCAFYTNALKKDYILCYPQSSSMVVEQDPNQAYKKIKLILSDTRMKTLLFDRSTQWLKQQTWQHITHQYLALWEKREI